jgi:PBSX family phage terminase large subunit
MIGCVAMIHLAVLKAGDYLIARQYMPELKDTTYKTFLEICPPELIAEVRVADMIVKLHTVGGGVSTIFFRGLEEPDKLRSLNLCAFHIDEANQVSEAAFILLQGRLRGKHWRKGFLTMNPGGHDWSWRWFVRQDHISDMSVKSLFSNIRAPSMENVHLPDGYVDTLLASWSEERIKREIMGSDDVFEGQIYNEFDRSVHVIKPFRLPEDWVRRIGCDHGFRNQAAWIYGAVSPDGDLYIYREFYEKEFLIEDICKANKKLFGNEVIEQARMDPSTRAASGTTGKSDWDAYIENLPSGFPLLLANNEVSQGIDRVKSYLKPDKRGKPRLYVFDTCGSLLDEMAQYKWKEQPTSQQDRANVKEEPVKHNDHAVDALRYLVMTCPEPEAKTVVAGSHLKEGSLERALFDDLARLKKRNKSSDPFGNT